jgi:hypothetical protein
MSWGNKSRVPLHLGTFILYHLGLTGTILHLLMGLFNGNSNEKWVGWSICSNRVQNKCSVVTPGTTKNPSPLEWRRYFFNPVDSDVIASVAKQ